MLKSSGYIALVVRDTTRTERLRRLGIESQMARSGTAARSLYFVDYDNHLFELHVGQMERELERDHFD